MKTFFKTFIYIVSFIFFGVVLFSVTVSLHGNKITYYKYLDSAVHGKNRFSLYLNNYGRDGAEFVLFMHDINYVNYKSVEVSKVSLSVYNNNIEDIFIDWFFIENYMKDGISIDIVDGRYLVIMSNKNHVYLYDIFQQQGYKGLGINSSSYIRASELNKNDRQIP